MTLAESITATHTTRSRTVWVAVFLGLALVIATICSLAFGARVVSLSEVLEGLFNPEASDIGAVAVGERRIRTLFAIVAGASLGVCGALLQAVTRNPLAEPGILGINTGASLAVVCGIAFLGINTVGEYVWLALLGAILTSLFVYAVGSLGRGGATPIKLALAGAATTAALGSLVSAVLLPRTEVMDSFRFWMVGSVGGATKDSLITIAPFLIIGFILAFTSAPALNALALGQDVAVGLGVKVGRTRAIAALAAVLLCAAVTAVAGPIAFLGLMVPHMVRLLVGADQRIVIALSAIGGAAILTLADTVGRVIARPLEVEVGVLTAFIGAPILIIIARNSRMREL